MNRDWDIIREQPSTLAWLGAGSVRVALLFGSAAVALSLLLVPVAENYARPHFAAADGLDAMSTGSIRQTKIAYTTRRSVLQSSPAALCVIRADGSRSGDC